MKRVKEMCMGLLVFVLVVGGIFLGQYVFEDKPDLSLSAFASVRSGVPAVVTAFEASEVGDDIESRQVEGTNFIRVIPVMIEGQYVPSWAIIDKSCAIPPPGTHVTVEIAPLNSKRGNLGWRLNDSSAVLTTLECRF